MVVRSSLTLDGFTSAKESLSRFMVKKVMKAQQT